MRGTAPAGGVFSEGVRVFNSVEALDLTDLTVQWICTMSLYNTDLEKPGASALEHENAAASPLGSVGDAAAAFSPAMQKRVLRKMDLRLIPMLALLYLLAFLDRGNIGNAKIEGMLDDLHMTGPQYNWCCMCEADNLVRYLLTNSDGVFLYLCCV